MKPTQIIDLDGCISDDRWRIPLIDHIHPVNFERYRAYHEGAYIDDFVNRHAVRRDLRTVVITARPVSFEPMTRDWLRRHKINPHAIIMRNDTDARESVHVKFTSLCWLFGIAEYDVAREDIVDAIDDRPDIIDMYRQQFQLRARVVRIA